MDAATWDLVRRRFYLWTLTLTLAAAVQTLAAEGFVRAGKAQVVNVKHLVRLESRIGGGLDGTLDNGEHILISRRCAKELRECLKGGLFL